MGDDTGDDTRWMTYAELAEARGISKQSATRLAFRRRWPRKTGNDGTARVAVPLSELEPPPDATHDIRGGLTRTISALEQTITFMQEQLDRERRLADEARADLRTERDERLRLSARIAAMEAEVAAAREGLLRTGWARLQRVWRR